MKKLFMKLNQKLLPSMVENNYFMKKDYVKISVNTDDDVPMNKILKFWTLIIIIRCVFQKGEELDPLIYLDKCLYKSV